MRALFGGKAQMCAGVLFLLVTAIEAVLWAPSFSVGQVAVMSLEANVFAAYAVFATGLAYRVTERVERHVDPELDP